MLRKGLLAFGTIALGASLVLAAGCKKDDGKGDGKQGMGTVSAGGVDDLSLLPVDSEMVMGLNFAQLQQSALWKQFVEPKIMASPGMAKLAEFKAKCGFDPMVDIKSLSIGLKNVGDEKPEGSFVIHGLDKGKTWDCLDKMKEEAAKDGTEIVKDGDIAFFKNTKDNQTVAFTFVNGSTALAVMGPAATKDGVKAAAAGTSALKSSAAFVDMYGKIKSSDSLWMLMNGNSKVFDKAAGALGSKPKAIFGSINVTDGLSMDMRIRFETADQATQFGNLAKSQSQAAASMVDKIDVTTEGTDVKFVVVISSQKLQDLIKQFAGMAGAFGGGM
jgi:hypothetical protein